MQGVTAYVCAAGCLFYGGTWLAAYRLVATIAAPVPYGRFNGLRPKEQG